MRCGQGRVKDGSDPEITYLCTRTIKVFVLPVFPRLSIDPSAASGMLAIGDVEQLSPNASVMLRIATLTAWAELEIAGTIQEYLQEVLKPQRATLATLWISSLRDYATIRGDSEVLQETASAGMDTISMSLGKEVLLPVRESLPRKNKQLLTPINSIITSLGLESSRRFQSRCNATTLISWPRWMGERRMVQLP